MKKFILTILGAVVVALNGNAKIITVSNDNNSPGQYTDLQQAIDDANAGDTILIHASGNPYTPSSTHPQFGAVFRISKKLTLIGEGALPNQQRVARTRLQPAIYLVYDPATQTNATGTKLIGLNTESVYIYPVSYGGTTYSGGDSIHIERCNIKNMLVVLDITSVGNTIINNVIRDILSSTYGRFSNSVFSNNIIGYFGLQATRIINGQVVTDGTGANNNLIANNIIFSKGSDSGKMGGYGDVFVNNVFYSTSGVGTQATFNPYSFTYQNEHPNACTFEKNIFFSTTTQADFNATNNIGTNNLFGVNAQFVTDFSVATPTNTTPQADDITAYYSYVAPANGPFLNFHLQPTSPGKNYGTDGTDVGIYGGLYPWVDGSIGDSRFRYFPMPNQVPYVISVDITNPVVPVDGTFNVNFNAKTQE